MTYFFQTVCHGQFLKVFALVSLVVPVSFFCSISHQHLSCVSLSGGVWLFRPPSHLFFIISIPRSGFQLFHLSPTVVMSSSSFGFPFPAVVVFGSFFCQLAFVSQHLFLIICLMCLLDTSMLLCCPLAFVSHRLSPSHQLYPIICLPTRFPLSGGVLRPAFPLVRPHRCVPNSKLHFFFGLRRGVICASIEVFIVEFRRASPLLPATNSTKAGQKTRDGLHGAAKKNFEAEIDRKVSAHAHWCQPQDQGARSSKGWCRPSAQSKKFSEASFRRRCAISGAQPSCLC